MTDKLFFLFLSLTFCGLLLANASTPEPKEWKTLYEEDFEDIKEGELPDDFFVLDGSFSVSNANGRKCLVLSSHPVGEHGFLFGPRLKAEDIELSFSCMGAVKSRRHSVFAANLGGMRGFKFRINPGTNQLLLNYNENWSAEGAISWSSNAWMRVCVRTFKNDPDGKLEINVQISGESNHKSTNWKSWTFMDNSISSGKCILWGYGYAEREMYWDDLVIRAIESDVSTE